MMRDVLCQQISRRVRRRFLSSSGSSSTSGGGFGPLRRRRAFSSHSDDDRRRRHRDAEGKTALVLGSSGALGSALAKHFKRDLGMNVIGADVLAMMREGGNGDDDDLDAFVQMPTPLDGERNPGLGEMTEALAGGLCGAMGDGGSIDAIVCAAGGWRGDPEPPTASTTSDDDGEFLAGARSFGESIDAMMSANLHPVLAAGYVADRFMAEEGLFVVLGAARALSPTPGMLGYGLAKGGAHHFVQTLGELSGKSATTKSRRRKARELRSRAGDRGRFLDTLSVVGILPTAAANGGREAATRPEDIANEIGTWIRVPALRPHSGGLVKAFPDGSGGGGASFHLVR